MKYDHFPHNRLKPQNAVFRKGDPSCQVRAVIPSITVPAEENLEGIRDALVHVEANNTTYYIDHLHRRLVTWRGPVFADNYDFKTNPRKVKDNLVYDKANNRIIAYAADGTFAVFGIGVPIDQALDTGSPKP